MRVCIAQNVSLADHLALSTYLRSITKYLAKQESIELVLLPLKGSHIPSDIPQNIEIHEIEGSLYSIKGNIKYAYNLYKKISELSKEKPIDIIHCLYPNSAILGACLFKRKSPNTKIIYDIRSPWIEMSIEKKTIPKFMIPIYRMLAYQSERTLAKHVDGFIFITEGLKKFYEGLIELDNKPTTVIPSGVDIDMFSSIDKKNAIRTKYKISEEDFLIGYVGVISKMRELDFILNTFKNLINNNKKYKLMFVGDGDAKEYLEKLSTELKIQDNVIFTGRVPYEQVPYYMSEFNLGLCHLPDKFVFRYSFPMKVLEYLACGIPVLASDIEAHREIAMQVDNIRLYKNEEEALTVSLYNFSNLKPDNKRIQDFSWFNLTNKIIDSYKRVL